MHQHLQRIRHGMALWHQYGVLNIGGVNHEKRNGGGWRLAAKMKNNGVAASIMAW
jgi:hypothetical protein